MHSFDPDVAKRLGINAAIIIANLVYLQTQREMQGGKDYYFEGRWWVRHTYESLSQWHSYLSVPQIKRIMKKLVEDNHIVMRHPKHFDRTTYWSVAPEFLHSTESSDGKYEIVPSDSTKSYDVLHDNNIEHTFSLFWDLYPKKTDKKNSRTKFKKLSEQERQSAIEFLKRKPFEGTEVKYVPNPTTFINGARWEDEITPTTTNNIGAFL